MRQHLGEGAAHDADDVGHVLVWKAGPELMLMMLSRLLVFRERASC